jgi:hypothetical protein
VWLLELLIPRNCFSPFLWLWMGSFGCLGERDSGWGFTRWGGDAKRTDKWTLRVCNGRVHLVFFWNVSNGN